MPSIAFECQPSRTYAGWVSTLAGVAGVSVCLLPWLFLFKLLILLFIAAYTPHLIRREVYLQHPLAVLGLAHREGRQFELQTAAGSLEATLAPSAVVTRWVSILPFSVEGSSRGITCLIFPDALPGDGYRQFLAIF